MFIFFLVCNRDGPKNGVAIKDPRTCACNRCGPLDDGAGVGLLLLVDIVVDTAYDSKGKRRGMTLFYRHPITNFVRELRSISLYMPVDVESTRISTNVLPS